MKTCLNKSLLKTFQSDKGKTGAYSGKYRSLSSIADKTVKRLWFVCSFLLGFVSLRSHLVADCMSRPISAHRGRCVSQVSNFLQQTPYDIIKLNRISGT